MDYEDEKFTEDLEEDIRLHGHPLRKFILQCIHHFLQHD